MAEAMPLVSIITVCFNSARTIERTIKSVLGQTYPYIEYIIIDGGSSDGTVDIIKKYKDKLGYWVSECDAGIYDAMNKGIDKASGDFIGIINSDDWYEKETVAAASKALLNFPACGVVHGREIDIYEDGSIAERSYKNIIGKDCLVQFCHPTFFVRRSIYQKYGKFDCKYPTDADGDFVYRLYLAGVQFHYDSDVVACFSYGTGASASLDATMERLEVHKKYAKLMPQQMRDKAFAALGKAFTSHEIMIAIRYLDQRINWNKTLLNYDEKIIIFGFSEYGKMVCDWLLEKGLGKNNLVFWDNDKSKEGRTYFDISTEFPYKLINKTQKICIVVATINYFREMSSQLDMYGYKRGKDYFDVWSFKAMMTGTDISGVMSWVQKGRPFVYPGKKMIAWLKR